MKPQRTLANDAPVAARAAADTPASAPAGADAPGADPVPELADVLARYMAHTDVTNTQVQTAHTIAAKRVDRLRQDARNAGTSLTFGYDPGGLDERTDGVVDVLLFARLLADRVGIDYTAAERVAGERYAQLDRTPLPIRPAADASRAEEALADVLVIVRRLASDSGADYAAARILAEERYTKLGRISGPTSVTLDTAENPRAAGAIEAHEDPTPRRVQRTAASTTRSGSRHGRH